ncbi:MAG: hypothetical protein ACLP0J_04565 [Solirubrobacteraceae bacterium]
MTVIWVSLSTMRLLAAVERKLTPVAPVKLVSVISSSIEIVSPAPPSTV